ncbi:MAG TPA: sialate O-acetylesterase [Steroidobacteraceae bacterium]|nr:sialate O-acetylesterase [Steroidobacteraceae bacterium]
MRTQMKTVACVALILAAAARVPSALAQLRPGMLFDPLFDDHLVLQRDRPIAVWGRAPSGTLITVSLDSARASARADAQGRWRATLPPRPAGGPFVLTARTGAGLGEALNDVLVGDVFLCSGQSNMVLPVNRVGDSRNEIENSANATIRMATVDPQSSAAPLASFAHPLVWELASPSSVPDWSAACFFFARELQKSTHAPIGLVDAAYSGSRIEPWLTAAGLRTHRRELGALALLELYVRAPQAAQRAFASEWERWWRGRAGHHPGSEPWAEAVATSSAARAGWRAAPPALGNWQHWGVRALADFEGLLWYRARVRLSAAQARSAVALDLGAVNQVDETWVDGHALGNTFGYGTVRSYRVPSGTFHPGENLVVVNVLSTYEGGGLLPGASPRGVELADGGIVPLADWEYRAVPARVGYPPSAPWQPAGGVTTLYNAMIAPLGSIGLSGVLWYQGESNTDQAQAYQPLLAELMADWRRQFGADLPFLVVQLPNYGPPPLAPAESDWATLREAQRRAVAGDPHAALAVTIDIGEPRNLHPTDKQDVGIRLARAARHLIYGERIAPSGPIPLAAARSALGITVPFGDIAGRLVAYGHDTPIGFELCGADPGSCRYADARIEGSRVILAVPSASAPVRVRYCWAASPICTLYDLSGLPAGPFEIPIR